MISLATGWRDGDTENLLTGGILGGILTGGILTLPSWEYLVPFDSIMIDLGKPVPASHEESPKHLLPYRKYANEWWKNPVLTALVPMNQYEYFRKDRSLLIVGEPPTPQGIRYTSQAIKPISKAKPFLY